MAITICLAGVLFFKGGPYLKHEKRSFEKRNLWNSVFCWQVRKVEADLDKIVKERDLLLEAQKLKASDKDVSSIDKALTKITL